MRDYDSSVAFLGTWGRFQLMVFFLLCSTILPNGTGSFSLVFITDTPQHRCQIPDANLSHEWQQAAVPLKVVDGELQPNGCRRYRLDLLRNFSANGLLPGRDVNLSSLEQEDCADGWVYSTDVYQSTVVSQFDLVCSQHWKQPLTATIFFLGVLVGSFFSGVLADRFGRKPVLFATLIIQAVFSLAQIAAPSWEVFCLLLFCSGLGNISNYVSCYVLGRVTEAEAIVRKAAKMNRVVAPEKIFLNSMSHSEEWPVERYNVLDLLKNRSVAITTILLCWVWFALSVCYYGLSLNTSQLHSDPYISCFLSAVVEVPAYASCSLAIRYLPRRLAVVAVFITMGLALFSIQLVPPSILGLAVALEMLGKFGATAGTSLLFAFTAELYPTGLRNTASGICVMVSRTGSCIAPFVVQLNIFFKYLPYITLGALAMLSILATIFLPESFRSPLPESLEQMQKRKSVTCPSVFRRKISKSVVVESPL
ncbi:solute carrier family 22 member 4-like isoform X3 [Syngnathus typhle]|uniref:solute carrier family 22 member 4-like isoform X3 n=1 Tax=Syngnathus typhle TaxID=161592 RepID=UPI002A6B52E1|nr:solute carrier family 22 member 4-like isoform X3 [Syngnathus typhle]